jgi:hypothetical protein
MGNGSVYPSSFGIPLQIIFRLIIATSITTYHRR